MTRLTVLLFCFLLAVSAFGQEKYSNEFLNIGVSARGLAMSNSITASSNDISSAYFNPAGLTEITSDIQVAAMHSEYFAGISKYDYAAVAFPIEQGKRYVAISGIRFAVDDIPNTLQLFNPDGSLDYNNIKSFSVGDYAFLFSYAQNMKKEGLSVGGNAKIIYRSAGSFATAWGFGLDLGGKYRKDNLTLGLMLKDVTTTFNAWSFEFNEEDLAILESTNNELPKSSTESTYPRLNLGVAYQFSLSDKIGLLSELDIDATTDGKRNTLISGDPISIDPHIGIELDYENFIYLRAGIGNIQEALDDLDPTKKTTTVQPNIGAGFIVGKLAIDYALTDVGDQSQSLYSHVFSLKYDINKKIGNN